MSSTRTPRRTRGKGRKKSGQAKGRKPTLRQRRLMRNMLDGKSLMEAGLAAGYAKETVRAKGTHLLRLEHWAQLLERAGLSDEAVMEYLTRLIQGNETKFFQYKGRIITRQTISHEATRAGLDMFFKLRDAYPRPAREEEESFGRGPVVAIRFILQGSARDSADNGKHVDGIQFRIAGPRPQRGEDLTDPSGGGVGGGTGMPDRGVARVSTTRGLENAGPWNHCCADYVIQENRRGRLVQVCGRCGQPA